MTRAATALWSRELKRFLRQRSRIGGTLASPLVFWLLLGLGFGGSFRPPGTEATSYLEYFFPGTVVMIVLFTAIFSTISIINDRKEGFLQLVSVAPASPASIALGKILGGTTVALVQGVILLMLARPAGVPVTWSSGLGGLGVLAVVAFGLTGLGFVLAWRMDSTQGFHAIMNLLFMPMWLLSGAVFPVGSASPVVGWIARLNPLTYGVSAFRSVLYEGRTLPGDPALPWALAITVLFAALMWWLAARVASRFEWRS